MFNTKNQHHNNTSERKVDHDRVMHYQNKLRYEIDSWDLHELIKNKKNIVIIDVRSEQAYQKEHILGAIHFSHKTMNEETTLERLDFGVEYITYCDGIGCNGSTKGALKLAQLGYKVKELVGGIDWWKRDGHPVEESQECQLQSEANCGCG